MFCNPLFLSDIFFCNSFLLFLLQMKYQIVLYGATTRIGRIATKYLADWYGNSVRWAIAAQDDDVFMVGENEGAGHPDVIQPGADQLGLLCTTTRVIVNASSDDDLLQEARNKCHYCDISTDHPLISSSLFAVVYGCTETVVPWDLSVLVLSKHLQSTGESLVSVDFYNDGGDNVRHTRPKVTTKYSNFTDNSVKKISRKCSYKVSPPSSLISEVRYRSPMAKTRAQVVAHSNHHNHYGFHVSYTEGNLASSVFWACVRLVHTRKKPKQLVLTGVAVGHGGTQFKSTFVFLATNQTARILVETAMVLLFDGGNRVSGIHTPATVGGSKLLKRLVKDQNTFFECVKMTPPPE